MKAYDIIKYYEGKRICWTCGDPLQLFSWHGMCAECASKCFTPFDEDAKEEVFGEWDRRNP